MSSLETLVSSLLYEGYCLYPYTPGAVKNSTPTPFGIVYPPAYVARQGHAFDHLQIECVLEGAAEARVEGEALFLQSRGQGHRAVGRRVALPSVPVARLARAQEEREFSFDGAPGETLQGRVTLAARAVGPGMWRVRLRVQNDVPIDEAEAESMDRRAALDRALLSTHGVLRCAGARFVSPVEQAGERGAAVAQCRNVNTWPVLATAEDDAVVGAAIFLPDHPRIAAESRVDFFDNTEIEEALVLHVQALSPAERSAIGAQDQAVREMIERAAAMSPQDVLGLHGVLRPVAPEDNLGYMTRPRVETIPGEETLAVGDNCFRRGGKVVLRLGARADPYERMLDGRTATIERLYMDYDDRAYLGVTLDGDPGQELLRETGRFLYFFTHEVEAVEP